MFLLHEPSDTAIGAFLRRQQEQTFSYREVRASREQAPHDYTVDHNRVLLGRGEESFAKAAAAIRTWRMFNLGWCRVHPPNAPIEAGITVAISINHYSFWSLNACRIVYVMEDRGAVLRYGFAYGTLPEHGEAGEERFSVEWDQENGSVTYDLYAFSRPQHLMARLGYPLSRRLQKRFARESKMAMLKAVKDGRI